MINRKQKFTTQRLYFKATRYKANFITICSLAGFDERDINKYILWKINKRLKERIQFNEKGRSSRA